jgi:hypothetical protein
MQQARYQEAKIYYKRALDAAQKHFSDALQLSTPTEASAAAISAGGSSTQLPLPMSAVVSQGNNIFQTERNLGHIVQPLEGEGEIESLTFTWWPWRLLSHLHSASRGQTHPTTVTAQDSSHIELSAPSSAVNNTASGGPTAITSGKNSAIGGGAVTATTNLKHAASISDEQISAAARLLVRVLLSMSVLHLNTQSLPCVAEPLSQARALAISYCGGVTSREYARVVEVQAVLREREGAFPEAARLYTKSIEVYEQCKGNVRKCSRDITALALPTCIYPFYFHFNNICIPQCIETNLHDEI